MPGHIFGHGRLADIDPKLKQFPMESRSAPERIGQAHFPNQISNVLRDPRPAATRPREPAPIGPKAAPMPSQHCFRPDDRKRIDGRRAKPVEPQKGEPVEVRETRPLRRLAPEDIDLLTENQYFRLKPSPRLEQRSQDASKQNQNIDHEDEASTDSLPLASPNWVSGRHRASSSVWPNGFATGTGGLPRAGLEAPLLAGPLLNSGTAVCAREQYADLTEPGGRRAR